MVKVMQVYHKTRNASGRPVPYNDFHILISVVAICSLQLPIFQCCKSELVNQKAEEHSRPLILSSKTSCFQNEAKCETFLVKINFILMRIKARFRRRTFHEPNLIH